VPSALPDFVVTNAATPVTINVLANDTGTGLTITSFSNPTNGSLVFNGDKTFTYTPASGFIGDDGFAYTVRDAQGTPANGEVTISVVANTGATVAVDDLVEVIAGNEVVIPVRANDMAADGGALQIIAVSMPGHGAVNVLPDQTIRYVPQSGFTGIDSFNYTVVDGLGSSASATVTVKVLAKSNPPLAIDDTFTIEAGAPTMLAVLANDSDPDGGPLQVVGYTMPAHGQLVFNADKTFVYTPAAGYLGTDQFTYTIRNNRGASAVATVTLAVAEILEIPVAFDDQVTTEAALPVTIDVLANDALPAGQQISIVAVTLPFKGKLAFNPDKTITYTPNPGFVGIDDFTYTIGNGQGGTAKAKVTVDVTPASIAAVYANGYACRRRLAIPAGSARGTSHQNFPLWVELAGSWLKSTANGGKVASADGRDLRFELEGGIRLAHELEHYDAVAGKLGAWVRLPELGAEQPTVLLLYYGKPGLAASEAEPMAVWSDYLAVWHLPSVEDVTSEARLLTPTGTIANSADGLGAGALALDGNGVLMLAETSWLQGLSALSIQLRSKASSIGHDRGQLNVGTFGRDLDSDLCIRYQAEGFASSRPTNVIHAKLRTTAGNTGVSSAAGVHTTNWQGLTVAWQSGDSHPDMYLDGRMTEPSFTNRLSGSATTDPGGPLYLGAGPRDTADGGWVGLIDEVRFSARKLGEAWIATEYANQASPAGFYGYGGEETVTDTEPSIVALPLEITSVAGQHVDIDVLAAAIPAGMDGTVIESVTQANHGSVSVIDGKIRYTPVAGYAGSDSFTYRLNSAGRSSTALITATVKSAVSQGQDGTRAVELPPPLRTITVTSQGALDSAKAAALPGDHIIMSDGSYNLGQITKGGTEANPVVFKAANNQGVTITGFAGMSGSHVRLWGMDLSGSPQPRIAGSHFWAIRCKIRKSWRVDESFARFWYCDCQIPNNANSRCIEFDIGRNATDYHVYKCYFHDSHNTSGNNFEEMVQCGFGNSNTNKQQRGLIEECLFKNIGQGNTSSETIGIKGSGVTVLRCTYDNARLINVRHGAGNQIELCHLKGVSGINARDADTLVLNNRCIGAATMTIGAGDVAPDEDGGNSSNWPTSAYPYGFRTLLYNNNTATAPVVGSTFSNASITPLPAKNTVIQGHVGTLPTINFAVGTNPSSQWIQASPYEAEAPVELTQSDIGLFADL
jgi:hypothetical protein